MEITVRGIVMNTIKPKDTTVVICAAGMGTRLGIGTTKALVDIDGTPLIIHQLELLKEYDDIRIVVGFQAERLIQIVKAYRKDIAFAFNYEYEKTGVADSLRKGMFASREWIISLDGDILVNSDDFEQFLAADYECLGIIPITSEEPVRATIERGQVKLLSKNEGNMQWPGIVKIRTDKLTGTSSHVYDVINKVLPLPAFNVRAREIDTQEDYEEALEWFKNGQVD